MDTRICRDASVVNKTLKHHAMFAFAVIEMATGKTK